MIQVILNGAAIGHIANDNARVFLGSTSMTVVSQTVSTLSVKG